MITIDEWAHRWNIAPEAMNELISMVAVELPSIGPPESDMSEEAVGQRVLLVGRSIGQTLWRNNSGCLPDARGRMVRFGLANTSARVNKKFKSPDYVGITSVTIHPHHIGRKFGIFTGIETKRQGWSFPKNEREKAQMNFLHKIQAMGGIGMFVTDSKQVVERVGVVRGYQW